MEVCGPCLPRMLFEKSLCTRPGWGVGVPLSDRDSAPGATGVSWTQPTAAGSQRRETWSVKVSGLIRLIMGVFRIDPSVYIIESLITRRKWEGTR